MPDAVPELLFACVCLGLAVGMIGSASQVLLSAARGRPSSVSRRHAALLLLAGAELLLVLVVGLVALVRTG